MNYFRAKKIAEYQWKAKTKYYLHSPFVYQFYLNVLEGEVPPQLTDKYHKFIYRLVTYFDIKKPFVLKKDSAQTEKFSSYDLIFCDDNLDAKTITQNFSSLKENAILIVKNMYEDEARNKTWNEVKRHPSVTLTIDIFRFGICFFRKEKLAKENFVLRY